MMMDGPVMDFTKITDMIINVGKWKIIIDEKQENISELTCHGFSSAKSSLDSRMNVSYESYITCVITHNL